MKQSRTRLFAAFLFFLALWLLWSGHFDPLLVGMGVGASAIAVLIGQRLAVLDDEGYPLRLAPALLTFIPWVAWQIVKANVAVARIILDPRLPIRPYLCRIRASQKTALGHALHASTITITPGTVALDVRERSILVHALTRDAGSEDADGALDARVNRVERGAL